MYNKLIGVSYRALDLIQQGKEVKLEGFAIKTVADVLALNKTTLLTARALCFSLSKLKVRNK